MNIALVGNPNVGKTFIFNKLTKSNNKTGNWHGVTTDVAFKKVDEHTFYDVPGIYSLTAYSGEENKTIEFLQNNACVVVCVINGKNPNYLLANMLKQAGLSVITYVNNFNNDKNLKNTILSATKNLSEKKLGNTQFTCEDIAKLSNKRTGTYGYSKLDKILLHNFWGIVCFAIIVFAVFYLTFGPVGKTLSEWFGSLFHINHGALLGIVVVAKFLPQVALMFFCVHFLEQSGYLARVSFLLNGVFEKIGLTGKSAFSLLLGFGCSTAAIATAHACEEKNASIKTAIILPFISCSAKLPIFTVFAAAFFGGQFWLLLLLYLIGIVIGGMICMVLERTLYKSGQQFFILEFPPYMMPKKLFKSTAMSVSQFVMRIFFTVVISGAIVYFLSNYNFALQMVDTQSSVLFTICNFLAPIFTPLGFGFAGAVAAIICGLAGKELVVSTLAVLGCMNYFTSISAFSFLLFCLLYVPCFAAMSALGSIAGKKAMWFAVGIYLATAYLASFIFYTTAIAIIFGGIGAIISIIFWVIAFLFLITIAKKRKCGKLCCNGKTDCSSCGQTERGKKHVF